MKTTVSLWLMAIAVILTMLGIPQDAMQTLRRAHDGDQGRYFKYLQTARHEGVPEALRKYGVKPN